MYVPPGDISQICFGHVSVLAKMTWMNLSCRFATSNCSFTCLTRNMLRSLVQSQGREPVSIPLATWHGISSTWCELLLFDMLHAPWLGCGLEICFHSGVTGQAVTCTECVAPAPAKEAKMLQKCISQGQGHPKPGGPLCLCPGLGVPVEWNQL